jgi:excinuclease ABC subunit B
MYADKRTKAMDAAIDETNRRRARQVVYNAEHGINPQTIRKAVGDILDVLRPSDAGSSTGRGDRRRKEHDRVVADLRSLPQQELARLIQTLEEEMNQAASDLRFEYAARLRDEVKELRRELRDAL